MSATRSSLATPGRDTKTVAIVQSNYIPWKGYFDLIGRADEFILLDDVQYTRRDWRNRNRIKTPNGTQWLSIPVQVKGKYTQLIQDTVVSEAAWAAKHWATIRNFYARAPHFATLAERLEQTYREAGALTHLSDINRLFIERICGWIGLGTRLCRSTDYLHGDGKSERLLDLCRQAGATVYLSGPAARGYLDETLFADHGIRVEWMDYGGYPSYPQLHGEFDHFVTILDLLLNVGPDSARAYMKSVAS